MIIIKTSAGQSSPSWCLITTLVVMFALTTQQAPPSMACPAVEFAPDSNEARLADATTGLGINFINSLTDKAGENVVISPLSLMSILNMLLLGADENSSTQQQLQHVLGYRNTSLSETRLKAHEAARNICIVDQDGAANNQVNFTLANLLLTNEDLIELREDYEKELGMYYNVKVEQFTRKVANVSTTKEPNKVAPLHERVNAWVRNQTQAQIEKLAEESDLSSDNLIMVLLNAAYFKARWLHTFNTKSTQDRTFYNRGKETADVKFMSQKGVFGYADFNTNARQLDVSMSSDSRTRTSDDEETLLTEDVPPVSIDPVTATGSAGNASTGASTGKPGGAEVTANSSVPSTTTPTPPTTTRATATAAATSPEPSASPPTIELSKDEARRLELSSKLNCSALMLPFSLNDGQDLSMVILLPAKRDGLGELMANLNAQSLNEIYRSLTEQRVKIELPKFNFESAHDAKETLKLMGLASVFSETAELGRMYRLAGESASPNSTTASKTPVKVDKVIHKVKIGVDESGAEAAAASMVTLDLRNFVRPATPTFVADHPFLFIIRHNKSNMPLFMGQVNSL